uniref:Leucine rich pentatricopeptide repeat containing n=1 Tax=Astyanax mexicanus TaxID=7994 RepID=A0A8B9LPQ4_ASTMX
PIYTPQSTLFTPIFSLSWCFKQKGEVAEEPSAGIRNTQADNFDWALSKLDNSVRRTGRITKTLLQKIFQDICRKGYPSGNQALLLLRSCGSLLPEVPLQERTEFAHHVWEKLKTLGVAYDVSHYNALLKVYLQNEFKFSPTDFLAKMEAANVQPNRVTYQRLLAAYCQDGDIEGASKILAFMKSKDLPVTEAVFNSLVTGHSRAGDLESAANILSVMRGAGIEPSSDTYVTLLCAYAENGDITKIKEVSLDRELMQVAFSLAKAGHQQHAREILELVKHDIGYIPEAMNLCLSLITLGMEDTAFSVLRSFPILKTESPIEDSLTLGNFFLRHCVNMNKSVEKLVFFCNGLKDVNFHSSPLQFTLHCALESKNTAMAVGLMKVMKKEGFPIRPHYFWPLLVQHQKDKDTAGMVEVLKAMQELDVVPDIDTYSLYVVGTFPSLDKAQAALQEVGFDVHTSDFVSAVVRFEAAKRNLSELYSLSDLAFSHFSCLLLPSIAHCYLCSCISFSRLLMYSPLALIFLYNAITEHSILSLFLSIHSEAEDLLKEIKEKNVQLRSIKSLFHTLNEHGLKGDTTTVQRLQDAMFTLGLVNPSSNLYLFFFYYFIFFFSPTLDAVIECNKLYQQLPRLHQVICALINKGDTELLQKAMDFVRKERGEMMMMYELLFGFLWTGRYKEARKIAETPGLRAKPGRLQWFAEKCISSQKMEALENMVDMTAKLFECDRDEMYHYLLCLCKITNNWQKAEAVWMKMQEENVIPREKTLILLADIFKSNQQPVPFEVPEVIKKNNNKIINIAVVVGALHTRVKMLSPPPHSAVRHMPEFKLSDKAASLLIVTQARSGKLEDALAGLKDMVQAEQVPMQLAIRQVLQGLAKQGDVKGIQEVQDTVGALCQSMNVSSVSFMNSTALAHITNGDLDSAVEVLESVYSRQQSAASVFRAVLTANDEKALDKLSAMAERLCNQFALYRPATDLFIQYLDLGKTEEAKFLLQRCAAIAEQRNVLTSYMSKSSNVPGKVQYDLSSAKALYQQMQDDGIQVDELSLKRLAKMYTDAGETVPFEVPQVNISHCPTSFLGLIVCFFSR